MSGINYQSQVTTAFLTNSSLVINNTDGVSKISVKNISAVAGTILGSNPFKNLTPAAITLAQNDAISILGSFGLSALTITAPAGCTLEILIS